MNEPDPPTVLPERPLLEDFLRDRDVPCPRCEYNLRGLQGTRCPECGDELALRINLAEPRLGALITGLVGLSAGAGLNGLLILYGLIQISFLRPYSGFNRFFVITSIGFLVLAIALWIWFRQWPRIRRASRAIQRWLAVAAWLLTLVDLIVFSLCLK